MIKNFDDSMEGMQGRIGKWADTTFTHDERGITLHLLRESAELARAIGLSEQEAIEQIQLEYQKPDKLLTVSEEAADVCILLFALAYHLDFILWQGVAAKHAVNIVRNWGKADRFGVTEHVA